MNKLLLIVVVSILLMSFIYLVKPSHNEEIRLRNTHGGPNRRMRRNLKFNGSKVSIFSRLLGYNLYGEPIEIRHDWDNRRAPKSKVKKNYKKYSKTFKNNKIRSRL